MALVRAVVISNASFLGRPEWRTQLASGFLVQHTHTELSLCTISALTIRLKCIPFTCKIERKKSLSRSLSRVDKGDKDDKKVEEDLNPNSYETYMLLFHTIKYNEQFSMCVYVCVCTYILI